MKMIDDVEKALIFCCGWEKILIGKNEIILLGFSIIVFK